MTEPQGSQHPVDRLIRDLIATGRDATEDEVNTILDRLAAAPFSTNQYKVPTKHRGQLFGGRILGAREPSLRYHLFERVVVDKQWVEDTSEEQYLNDLRAVARMPGCRLAVYYRRGGPAAAAIALAAEVLPPERLGATPLPWLIAVYAADRGTLISGYQISDLSAASIPGDATWYSGR